MRRATFAALFCAAGLSAQEVAWKNIQRGVDFASIPAGRMASGAPGTLYVVRVDPRVAKIGVGIALEGQASAQTAAAWCRSSGFAVAINLGMFQNDQRSNVGYLRHGAHVNNARWNDYRAAVGINRKSKPLWLDLDGTHKRFESFDIVVQNLRLITTKRKNVWAPSDRRWSEAALAIDGEGRLLFLFTRAPWSMRDFNDLLLKLPLGVAGAMHLEGGPEASLSIHVPGLDLDLAGSYESGFFADDTNVRQWPIPNVLGVVR